MADKPYLLFCFDQCYPLGGWSDFVGGFDTFEDAEKAGRADGRNFFQIVDIRSGEVMLDTSS